VVADQIVGERVPEELQGGCAGPVQVEVEAADQPTADLHRGEVGVPGEGVDRELAAMDTQLDSLQRTRNTLACYLEQS
jgi:hypothetical protein